MDWAFWSCVGVLCVAVVGLVALPDEPHESRTRAQLVRATLLELLDAEHAPCTTRELRRRLHMSRTVFYDLLDRLVRRGVVEAVTVVGLTSIRRTVRLTDRGLAWALRRPGRR